MIRAKKMAGRAVLLAGPPGTGIKYKVMQPLDLFRVANLYFNHARKNCNRPCNRTGAGLQGTILPHGWLGSLFLRGQEDRSVDGEFSKSYWTTYQGYDFKQLITYELIYYY